MNETWTPIAKTPLLLAYIKKLLEYENVEIEFEPETLQVSSYCTCGEEDCATVNLHSVKRWKKDTHDCKPQKGILFIHFEEDGWIELEALSYISYPYKDELIRVFKGDFSPPSDEEWEKLECYFQAEYPQTK